jgi:uncharacterized surface protein with fasciclin (FAS1) repeats
MNSQDMDTQNKDIVVNVANAGNFTAFHNALKASDLLNTYKGMGPFTLFAPTDEAFAKIPRHELHAILKDKAQLNTIINLHVMKGALLAKDLKESDLSSVHGAPLVFAANDSGFTVNGAKVSRQEIEASNGVIHGIDTVMRPKH